MCLCKYCDLLPQSKKSYVVLPPRGAAGLFGFLCPAQNCPELTDTPCEKNTGSQEASHHWSPSSVGSERSFTSLSHCPALPGSPFHVELGKAAAFHKARISSSLEHHTTSWNSNSISINNSAHRLQLQISGLTCSK